MSMLYLDTSLRLQDVTQWAKTDSQRMVRGKIHQLRKLQLVTEEHGNVSLNPVFRTQLRNALTGGGDFSSFGTPFKGSGRDTRITRTQLARYADQKWEAMLRFMVGRQDTSGEVVVQPPAESVRSILRTAKLMEDGENGMAITNSGFQFLLQDTQSQVWTVLLQYLRQAEMQQMDVVEVLNFLFQLVSLQLGRAYSAEPLTAIQRRMLGELRDFGLVLQDDQRPLCFYATHLVTMLSSSSSTNSGPNGTDSKDSATESSTSQQGELAASSSLGYIILETNCRIYAYTDSPLQIAILGLFVRLVSQFSNLVTGALTRDSVRQALSQGITADQIITFLTANAHPQMQSRVPVLPVTVTDQIRLWEQERNRLHPTHAHFYKDFAQKQDFDRVLRYAQDIGVVLWASIEKRQLVVTRQGHVKIVELVKSQRAASTTTSS
ncbi:RNA polymerase II transcription factor B 52 kDa subunit [Coemansia sp. RSA 1365]|nr:RNA polymerase II transcription factor B 52 kDa subunit [Coemansia sp. RSA 1365]